MRLLEKTSSDISDILKGNKKNIPTNQYSGRSIFAESIQKSLTDPFTGSILNIPDINILEYNNPKILLSVDRGQLESIFGKNLGSFNNISIGSHPDFEHLKYNQFCYHHCISMFLDIKGSTQLSLKYSLLDIRQIKDTILSAAIEVVNFFGGHVQRLQGDGLMIQFVRAGQAPLDSIINSLNAASVLTYFTKNELANTFIENDVKPLRIRIGIDYGKEQEVLWSHYGVDNCTELTTTSLHTDLSAKLQQRAPSNSILIGDNIKTTIDLPDEFYYFPTLTKETGEKVDDKYIFNNSYKMYQFDWEKYLLSHPYFYRDSDGTSIKINTNTKFDIKCEIKRPGADFYTTYFPNSSAMPKDTEIKYHLFHNGRPIGLNGYKILWEAENRGLEVQKYPNAIKHNFDRLYDNKTICETTASYLGHHYLKCKIERLGMDNLKLKFPIFVQ